MFVNFTSQAKTIIIQVAEIVSVESMREPTEAMPASHPWPSTRVTLKTGTAVLVDGSVEDNWKKMEAVIPVPPDMFEVNKVMELLRELLADGIPSLVESVVDHLADSL